MKQEIRNKIIALVAGSYLGVVAASVYLVSCPEEDDKAMPRNPRIAELYRDNCPEIVVNSNGRDRIFTQNENVKDGPRKEVLQNSHESKCSQIEKKLQGGNK